MEAGPSARQRPTLRRSLIVYFLLLIVGLSATVGLVTYDQFRGASVDLVRGHMESISARAKLRVEAFIEPTKSAARVAQQLAADRVIGFHQRGYLRALFLAYLQRNSQIQNVYFGDHDGNFLMVERLANDAGFRSKRIVSRAYSELKDQPPTALFADFDLQAGPFRELLEGMSLGAEYHPDPDTLDTTLRRLAERYPFAKQLIVGFPDGRFHKVVRTSSPEQQASTFESVRRTPGLGGTESRRGSSGDWSNPEILDQPYDPRSRAWYQKAAPLAAGSRPHWTNIYEFYDGQPGVSASMAVRDGADELIAVVGFDLQFRVYEMNDKGQRIEPTLVATFYNRLIESSPDMLSANSAPMQNLQAQRWAPTGAREFYYDCRTRPWFRAAWEQDGIAVTDVYVFAESRLPGVSVSVRAKNPLHDEPLGVVGVDLNVQEISAFLQEVSETMPGGGKGLVFLIDEEGRVIGFPTDDLGSLRSVSEPGRTRRLEEIETLQDIDFNSIRKTLVKDADRHRGHHWVVSDIALLAQSTRLDDVVPGRSWYLWVVVPEDHFMGPIRRNALFAGLIAVCAVVVAVIVSGLIRNRITRPLYSLVVGFRDVEQGRYFDVNLSGKQVLPRNRQSA